MTNISDANAGLLGEFIRAHRERILPIHVGLPTGTRRRTKGLRREELASLCRISTTWLTWIEQGRTQGVSAATLARIAEALQLTYAEREYLFDLAEMRDPQHGNHAGEAVAYGALQTALNKICSPAYLLDKTWDMLAWNPEASALFAPWRGPDDSERNLLRYMFLDDGAQALVVDWELRSQRLVAEFRADINIALTQAAMHEFANNLCAQSDAFRALWQRQDVLEREGGRRVFQHPTGGAVSYEQLTLRVANSPSLKLVMLI